jgi:glycine/serine hydroxymethyltransferase
LRGFNDVSAINSVPVAAGACLACVAGDVFGVVVVSAGCFVPVVPCSNEHIKRNSTVKTFSIETGGLVVWRPRRITNAIDYAKFYSRSHQAVIRVYDAVGNVIETHEHADDFKEW